MVRSSWLMAISLAFLSACHAGRDVQSAAECPAWKNIDFSHLPTHLNNDPDDPLLNDIWSAWANASNGIAWKTASPISSVHFITSPGGLTTDPVTREVLGRQSAGGWEIYARSGSAPGWRDQQWTDWRPVHLTPRGSDRLAAILRDPCLWVSPRFLETEVRLLSGRGDSRPDGPSTEYDVMQGNRRWGGWHISWSLGPPGQLRSLLLAEAFGLPEGVDADIGPDGWFDWPSNPQ